MDSMVCRKNSLLAFFILLASIPGTGSFAQEIGCQQFCIENVRLDTAGDNMLVATIFFAGDSSDFINYPFVEYVLNPAGDTIAFGTLNFFGHAGSSRQDYTTTTFLETLSPEFTATFNFRFDDTICALTYPCITSVDPPQQVFPAVSIMPNPFSNYTMIYVDPAIKTSGILYDANGTIVRNLDLTAGTTYILERDGLPAGIYFIKFNTNGLFIKAEKIVIY